MCAILFAILPSLVHPGCRQLPDPEVDALARSLIKLDAAQRPNGEDLPAELYVAWSAKRDVGAATAKELDDALRAIIDLQHALIIRLGTVPAGTPDALEIRDAYRRAHQQAYEGMAHAMASRRVNDAQRAAAGDAQVIAALEALRAARALRTKRCVDFGLPERLVEPAAPGGAEIRRARPG